MRSASGFWGRALSLRNYGAALVLLPLLAACHREGPTPAAHPHYELGSAWRGTHGWFYPNEQFDYHVTGLATRQQAPVGGLTADGETWSASGMTGAHQTLQLPAIVSIRNLLNGRIVRIRLTDRGPADPGRIIALSPKAADLLGMTVDTPVEVTEDEAASRALAEGLGKPPAQNISAAPVGEVRETSLSDGSSRVYGNDSSAASSSVAVGPLPTTWMQGSSGPSGLYVLMGIFSGHATAASVALRCGGTVLHASEGAGLEWRVLGGPYADIAQADAALDRTRLCGVEGARIIVE